MINKILFLCLFLCTFLFAQNKIITPMIISASDLTNLNKSNYGIYSEDSDLNEFTSYMGYNLCQDSSFYNHIDPFICKKSISYTLTNFENADIIFTNDTIKACDKKLIVCKENFTNCDIVKNKINFDNMKQKGFIPDPKIIEEYK